MRFRFALRIAAAVALLLGGSPGVSLACTMEIRPEATLITDSPWIFVGRIESVQIVEEDGAHPQLATVRILKVIHGPEFANALRVRSGPLHS